MSNICSATMKANWDVILDMSLDYRLGLESWFNAVNYYVTLSPEPFTYFVQRTCSSRIKTIDVHQSIDQRC